MEKGYRDYGHDIDNTDSVLEAGLGLRRVLRPRLHRPRRRRGEEGRRAADPQLVQVLVTDPSRCSSTPSRYCADGKPVGYVRAASYGHTLGGAVALAMVEGGEPVTGAWCDAAEWQVEVAGRMVPARASLKPLYDPTNVKIKA
jgi:4-methylaminobutanoate oxidase (formaldehyde-forming)